jgi:hypothetical protein
MSLLVNALFGCRIPNRGGHRATNGKRHGSPLMSSVRVVLGCIRSHSPEIGSFGAMFTWWTIPDSPRHTVWRGLPLSARNVRVVRRPRIESSSL